MGEPLQPAGMRADVNPASTDAELRALARARPELEWVPGRDIASARNAHATNTRAELAEALLGDYDWLEADVRLGAAGLPVMQHARRDPVELDLRRWLAVTNPSGRGLKLDVKERAALPLVIDAVRDSGVDEHRLIMNVGAWPAPELASIRRAFPAAIINISPASDADLTSSDLVQLQVAARIVGGPVMFPIREDLLDAGVVHALRPYGRVAAWNAPALTNPDGGSVQRLRSLGVDGMIDLREPRDGLELLQSTLTGVAARAFGWDAVHRALDAVGLL